MSVTMAEESAGVDPGEVVACPEGFVFTGAADFSWADFPVAGWIGDSLAGLSLDGASDAALLDAAAAWERLSCWAAGNQARVLAAFAARRPRVDPVADPGQYLFPERHDDSGVMEDSAADELSLVLRVDPGTAQDRLDFALELSGRFAATLAALSAGDVSVAKARILLDQGRQLDDARAGRLERNVLEKAEQKTPGQFRRLVRREVARIDAEALRRRAVAAVQERRVELVPLPDGMGLLRCELAGPDAIAAYSWLDQNARTAKAAGDGRTLDQLRADAFVDLVRRRSTSVASRPLIRVLVPISALAGGNSPGELAGYGPIDPDLARELAADGTWQRLFTDARGAVCEVDPRRYSPPTALKAFVQERDRTCRFPTCSQPAHRCEVDHTIRRRNGGPTAPANVGALCRRHHRLKDQPGTGWKLRQGTDGAFYWTTPAGTTFSTRADPPLDDPGPRNEPTTTGDESPPY